MGKIIEYKINRFDGGMSKDIRSKSSNKFSITSHFDSYTYQHKLAPYHLTEAVEDKTFFITKFLYGAQRSSTTYYVYGFGKASGTDKTKVYRIAADGTSWGSGNNNTSGLDKKEGCFIYYNGYIYMFAGTTKLLKYDTSGVDAFNDSYQTLTAFSTIAQGVHHPADDILYLFTDNKVHSLNNTSWTEAVLTLPSSIKIVDACPYGNYLAIGCVTLGTDDAQSIVYLWDRDSSLTTLTERIDFGKGILIYMATLNDRLIAVIDYFLSQSTSLNKGKLLIKEGIGRFGITLNELISDETVATNLYEYTKFVDGERMYFPRSIPLYGDSRNGIWVVDSNGRISLDVVEEEVATATTKIYNGIFKMANTWWIAHSGDGSVNRSDLNRAYSGTLASVYETLVFDAEDIDLTKKLLGATVMFEPLPSIGQIVLKYKKDADIDGSTWTTIFTEDTNDSMSHGAINIESSGVNLPEFKEIQFRIESTGGATITGFKFKAEVIDKQLY
jgi:hypothetical protein